jgi:hypothetical protein
MTLNVIVLDAARHQVFLKQQRRDPVTKELLRPGDRIVLCAGPHCGVAFLEESWRAIGEKHGGHTGTLRDIEGTAGPTHFDFGRRSRHAPPPPAQARANDHGAAPAPPANDLRAAGAPVEATAVPVEIDLRAADELRTAEGPFTLREIPFPLREIPFSLRQIAEF